MLKNYIKIALRNLARNSVTAFINLFGLSVAVGCAIVVYLFAHSNLTKNAFHENADRIFLVERITENGRVWGDTPVPLGPALEADFPQVVRSVRMASGSGTLQYEDIAIEERIRFVDAGFFDMFTFPLKYGAPAALNDPNALILSETTARKYFGAEDPAGRRITVTAGDRVAAFTVGGVANALPPNAGLEFHVLAGYESPLNAAAGQVDDWSAYTTATFIQVGAPEDIATLASQMDRYVTRSNTTDGVERLTAYEFGALLKINRDGTRVRRSVIGGVPWAPVVVLSSLIAFLLMLSCVNYMNIALAAVGRRLREIGVRKVMGGLRRQIAAQFLTENLLLCLIALVMGIEIARTFLIPAFNNLAGVNLALFYGDILDLTVFLVILLAGLSVASGAYPAFFISAFQPVAIFRQRRKTGGGKRLMHCLLTLQFVLAFITMIAGVVFTLNSGYQEKRYWGYDPAHTLVVRLQDAAQFATLRDEALRLPGVLGVAGSRDHIGVTERPARIGVEGGIVEAVRFDVSPDYGKTVGLRLETGQFAQTADGVVINEAFVRVRGWQAAPLGKTVRLEDTAFTVVGVVEDFHYDNFFQEIEPVVFRLGDASGYRFLSIRVEPGAEAKTAQAMADAWRHLSPYAPFEHFFQHMIFDEFFMESQQMTNLFTFTALTALLIACLGLFGLAAQNTADRLKEIGIRKVLGGSMPHITRLVNGRFLILLGFAALIATPVSYVLINALLDNIYAYHMAVGPGAFFIAYGLVFLTVVLTISTQVRTLAAVNPADVLRNE